MSRREKALNLLEGVDYLKELLDFHNRLPHERVTEFCNRQNAPLGINVWDFLIGRAEELENIVKRDNL